MTEPSPSDRARVRNRLWLLALAVLAMLPLGAALVLYHLAPQWIPGARTNHGALLDPPGRLEALELVTLDGREVTAQGPRRWRVIQLASEACDARCRERARLLGRVHLRLGRDRDRVVRLLALPRGAAADVAALEGADPGRVLTRAPAGLLDALLEERALVGGDGRAPSDERAGSGGAVLVADPLGNVILLYSPAQIGEPLLEDLKRLLRLSNIG